MADERYRRNSIYGYATRSQAALKINDLPEQAVDTSKKLEIYTKPYSIYESFTAKEVKEMCAARKAHCLSIALTVVVVLLGIVAVLRFSSIFEISKQTRLLNNSAAEISETITLEKTKLDDMYGSVNVKDAALSSGLQKPQRYQIEKVSITASDMTVVHNAGAESVESSDVWYIRLINGVNRFFGKIEYTVKA